MAQRSTVLVSGYVGSTAPSIIASSTFDGSFSSKVSRYRSSPTARMKQCDPSPRANTDDMPTFSTTGSVSSS